MPSQLSTKVTDGIRVNVRSVYVKDESSPKHRYYVFAYQVEIINESDFEVQLLRREWYITDGAGQQRLVEGDGVVGKQPFIAPGKKHSYVSGSHFQTPVGKMSGYYIMERLIDQSSIRVQIPPFVMTVPFLNN